ncbi:HlyD family secretion protein [Sideroxydans lithotrophicus]|uniref:Secretion protein HlyD family protein n=1 Tax=Sideroxydans lithotrophicus (strain ES-1) TaxID=580332 RepID=D5CRF9_SIDLE|nr:HlyD family secretion protein [Sideroxydans lithotrophicus]ADE11545.1 secretion protein HlyD family protein [Sideroxydans lithotrophicus ES-1]
MDSIKAHKKKIIIGLLLIALPGILAFTYYYGRSRSTENAYINADVVNVAAQVSGRVVAVHIKDNQHVHKGDALFDIDPQPFTIALERAQADLAQARQNARQDNAEVAAARAMVTQAESDLGNARSTYTRDKELVAQHFLSQQSLDDAQTHMQALQATLEQAHAKLTKALSAPVKVGERGDVLKAQAAIDQARLDLEHTHVVASQDGQISNLSLTAGSLVGVGEPLFALIADNSFHIDANYKETELPGIHPGQDVDIEIDMYPGQHFKGTVESISGGTGTAFSLLPPQNATGNWVKIAQRVPVRIKLAPTDAEHPLRIGATATVSVQLK